MPRRGASSSSLLMRALTRPHTPAQRTCVRHRDDARVRGSGGHPRVKVARVDKSRETPSRAAFEDDLARVRHAQRQQPRHSLVEDERTAEEEVLTAHSYRRSQRRRKRPAVAVCGGVREGGGKKAQSPRPSSVRRGRGHRKEKASKGCNNRWPTHSWRAPCSHCKSGSRSSRRRACRCCRRPCPGTRWAATWWTTRCQSASARCSLRASCTTCVCEGGRQAGNGGQCQSQLLMIQKERTPHPGGEEKKRGAQSRL